ncbi:flagellar motor switch protein FliM [Peptoanaerobacter stomatis]|uniref:Flagellar motor switch protein FliM n=1 Tax=Peptoanaerobacter stomatis TaxID=796937 RepID=J6H8F8_9FIRM|nr:flagellar motor switch protein FliM [Peptoanaerobacter stomatis]EHL17279.1 flagellar motor switch protein FliM [Peptoanaerobacter stomatis]EJU21500.1 flagellar motor switch protein FliM [Peptoanaerobacter stomatis]NWO24748.1 flagellar motor switch protein FliM [Peptostreptococcaceae bacterium oral taxon 081]
MAEVLSQKEIDALLSAIGDGDVSVEDMKDEQKETKIKSYDFKSPKKLAKDQLKTLSIIHDNYSRVLNTYLSGYLRVITEIEVSSVEELSYYEFNNSISNPAMIAVINFEPLPGQIIIETSNRLAFTMVDRILGGDGLYEGENRDFTEIELTILSRLVKNIIAYIPEAWENVIELSPYLEKIEPNSQFAQIVSPNETVALITLSVKIGEIEGLMNICLPHIVLEPIIQNLSTNFLFSGIKKEFGDEGKEELERYVRKAELESSAVVGEAYITVEDFIFMQVGDVIKLNTKVDSELELKVGGKTKFLGYPGTYKKNMAFKISKVIEKDEDEYDE